MLSLPNEILFPIANSLCYKDLLALSSTCKELYVLFKLLIEGKEQYIPWRIVIHTFTNKEIMKIDRSWITLGTSSSIIGMSDFENRWDAYPNDDEYCPLCAKACDFNYTRNYNTVYIHGEDTIKQEDMLTYIYKGIGGEILKKIKTLNYENLNGEKMIPISFFWDEHMDIGYIENENCKFTEAKLLKLRNLDVNDFKTDEKIDYSLMGLYLMPGMVDSYEDFEESYYAYLDPSDSEYYSDPELYNDW